MQGSIQERFIKLRSRIIYRASKPLHSSEQIIALYRADALKIIFL